MSTPSSLKEDTAQLLEEFFEHEIPRKVKDEIGRFNLTDADIDKMMQVMELEMKQGLSTDPAVRKLSSLQMIITYVRDLMDGTEEGDYLALDLGGTNFRVLHVKLEAGQCVSCFSKNYNIPESVLSAPCIQLFDHLADSIAKFLDELGMKDRRLPLGFTFSFPMCHDGLTKGHLLTWTKSFRHPDGVGEDAVQLLNEAIRRRGDINVDIEAILNDTTGTLMSGANLDHKCQIGLILGTGSNACYVEHLDKIPKWSHELDSPQQVVIDVEWGAFGDNHSLDFLKMNYDFQVDKNSNHVGSFTFEKLFSGMYIGEIARLLLEKLVEDKSIFGGNSSETLHTKWAFTAKQISQVETDQHGSLTNTRQVLEELGLSEFATEKDCKILRYLCEVLSIRAAQLISCALSVLLHHINKPEVTVAIDGSYYKYHPTLHDRMMHFLTLWVPKCKTKLILAEDGSGKGAAFVAAVACRMKNR